MVAAWRETEALPSEPKLTCMASEGRDHLRSSGLTGQPEGDRQTDRQTRTVRAEARKGKTSQKERDAREHPEFPKKLSSAPSDVSPSGKKRTLSWESPSEWS